MSIRRGFDAKLVFSNSGNLIAISTGSDACTEHEQGSKPLQSALCTAFDQDKSLIERLRQGEVVDYPQLAETKRLTKQLDKVQFILNEEADVPEAILGYSAYPLSRFVQTELSFPGFSGDTNVAGAWSDDSFAIRVRGKRYVKALQGFYKALLAGKVMFGGTFFRLDMHLAGVVLVNSTFIDDESKKAVKEAQLKYESDLRLKAKDDTNELFKEMREVSGMPNYYFGHLWVRWLDADESGVGYFLNPSYQAEAEYGGPYTREQLLYWAKSGFSYRLALHRKAA